MSMTNRGWVESKPADTKQNTVIEQTSKMTEPNGQDKEKETRVSFFSNTVY